MERQRWWTSSCIAIGAIGIGAVVSSFLPHSLLAGKEEIEAVDAPDLRAFPEIEVTFLRCGSVQVPAFLAVRGVFSTRPCTVAYSAALIRHPRGTFLYDTGLCADIGLFLMDQSFLFKRTCGRLAFTRSIGDQLREQQVDPADLYGAVLSHLHWDRVAGIPDLPGVPLFINRVEYEAASQQVFQRNKGLVRRLLSNNPVQLLDFKGPPYEGFRSSHDLFGDGSIILVPLPGHTAGQVGVFINRSNGARVFLMGDAAWFSENFKRPATMHPVVWRLVTDDTTTARQTLVELHSFYRRHRTVAMISMHDAQAQEAFMQAGKSESIIQI